MFRSSFEKNLENATSHLRLEPDWPSILLICDEINQKDVTPKNAFAAIKKKMNSPNPHSACYALLVLESIVKNCGAPVHEEVFTKENCEMLSNYLEQTPHENVRQKMLEMVQTWAFAFRSSEKYQAIKDTMTILKAKGHTFPELKESDAMFTADTAPNWADGKVCHRCRVEFTFTNRKHHCRNCGQVFCGQCTAKQCPLPKYGIEKDVRVCDGCFTSLQRPATKSTTRTTLDSDLPAEYLNSSLSQQVQTPPRKTEQELKEEEELQLALALSQSEAEQKKPKTLTQQTTLATAAAAYRMPQRSPSPEAPPAPKEFQQEETNPDLAKYLNRSYWEQRKVSESPMASPSAPSPMPATPQPQQLLPIQAKTADEVQIDEFAANMRTQVEIFVNRMKSNSSRGRSIANDSSVQTLFMTLTSLHSQQLSYIKEMDDKRMWYEQLQDKLVQIKDSRAALDVLRQEHLDKLRRIAEEQERQRQMQMAQKLEIMRKKKQEYLQYQRQLALQRIQEQEREMQLRQEQQKAQYLMGQSAPFPYMPGAAVPGGNVPPGMHSSPSHQLNSVYNPYATYQTQSPASGQFNATQAPQTNAGSIPPGMFNQTLTTANAPPNQPQQQQYAGMPMAGPNNMPPTAGPPNGQMLQQPNQALENPQVPSNHVNMQPPMSMMQQQQQQQQHMQEQQHMSVVVGQTQQYAGAPPAPQQHLPGVPPQPQQQLPGAPPLQQQQLPGAPPLQQQQLPVAPPLQQQQQQLPGAPPQQPVQHASQMAHVMLQQQHVMQTQAPIAVATNMPPVVAAPPAATASAPTTVVPNTVAVANSQVQAVAAAPAPPQNEPEPASAVAEPATAELISFD